MMKNWLLALWLMLLLTGCTELEKITSFVVIILILLIAVAIAVAIVIYHNRKHLPQISATVSDIKDAVTKK